MSVVRENGLRAAAYVAVIDLHPQVADLMLEALATEGVAAYAAPVASIRGLLLPAQFPTGPLDRLFVDRDAYETARRVLDEHLPSARAGLEPASVEAGARGAAGDEPLTTEPTEASDPSRDPVDDETWSKIVAAFHGTGLAEPPEAPDGEPAAEPVSARPSQAWPDAEDLDADADDEMVVHRASPPPATASKAPGQDEDRYVPPPPPPLPVADATTRLAWAGVIGGPLLFILALLLDWDLASWAQLAGVAGLVVGFVTLVARMRDEPADNDPDNGAVV
jgi:hypothetical protein